MKYFRQASLAVILALGAASANAAPTVRIKPFNCSESEYNNHSNDTSATADSLLGGSGDAPSYFAADDVDYYGLDVRDVPSTLTAQVQGVGGVVISGDPEVWLESSSGTILAHSDDIAPGANLDCFLRYVFTTRGAYFVRVQHSAKSTWHYNYSNYYLTGEYRWVNTAAAVRPSRWMLYR